jgi:hypothetical protein
MTSNLTFSSTSVAKYDFQRFYLQELNDELNMQRPPLSPDLTSGLEKLLNA